MCFTSGWITAPDTRRTSLVTEKTEFDSRQSTERATAPPGDQLSVKQKNNGRRKQTTCFWTWRTTVMQICIHKDDEMLSVPQLSAEALFVHAGTNRAINYRCFICFIRRLRKAYLCKGGRVYCTWSVWTVAVLVLKQTYWLHNTGGFPISCNALLDVLNWSNNERVMKRQFPAALRPFLTAGLAKNTHRYEISSIRLPISTVTMPVTATCL